MIFRGFGLRSLLLTKLRPWISLEPRFYHDRVQHNPEKKNFFIILDKYDKQAVLRYIIKGQIMDLYSIHVPKSHKGQGIARLLTDTAFTFAVVNDYFLYLTCSYAQKYYLANKNNQLAKRIVGPKSVLNVKVSLDSDFFDSLPDPEDPSKSKK